MASKKRSFRHFIANQEKPKLHLVLDLDHTLIHTVYVSQLSEKEKYLIEQVDSSVDLWRVNEDEDPTNDYIIKLRPFVREFQQEANKLFTMYVYTMGNSSYAQTVLDLIDPDRVYFEDRVITYEKSPTKKTLAHLAVDKRTVVIVDDTREVWASGDKKNLLEIAKYFYFRDGANSKSYAEKKRDESRSKGSLAQVLKILKDAHSLFGKKFGSKDLRILIDHCRRKRQCCFLDLLKMLCIF
ncbi:unnamed protein product [Microthlaspi erraticum]|uniref:RNA polymerase II C-terminal domain phosphatase-like n=1 Tax=Microthlaspi erraticum TaxID=1685480 RepID=A0A6D2KZ84_9BRAS|nr:unnamed protein product [Microthlaspi erraticum]